MCHKFLIIVNNGRNIFLCCWKPALFLWKPFSPSFIFFKEALFLCLAVTAKIKMLCVPAPHFFQADRSNRSFLSLNSISRLQIPLLHHAPNLKSFLPSNTYMKKSAIIWLKNESSYKFTGSSRRCINWRLAIQVPHRISLLGNKT